MVVFLGGGPNRTPKMTSNYLVIIKVDKGNSNVIMFEEEHNKKYKKIFRIQPFRKDGMRRN
jgi:hypothetical protein